MERVASTSIMIKMFLALAFLTNIVEAAKATEAPKYSNTLNSTNATLEKEEHGSHLDMPFLILLWATMVIQCIVYSLLSLIPHHCYTPPFTLVMAVVGVAFGLFGVFYLDEAFWENKYGEELLKSLSIWANMQADAILFVLLPPLLFDAAYNVDFHIFSRILPAAVIMALPGVILAVAATACCVHMINTFILPWIFKLAEWSWEASFLSAAVLSATDPVAVVAILHTLGAPEKLSTLIEGESLLNDGSAMVIFVILRNMVKGGGYQSVPPTTWCLQFVQLAVGGVLSGWFSALITAIFLRAVNNPVIEVSILTTVVFTIFFVAEHYLGASGVLCVVVFGIYMSRHKKSVLSPQGVKANQVVWATVSFYANSIIFVLSGVVIVRMVVELLQGHDHRLRWGYSASNTPALIQTTFFNTTTAPKKDAFVALVSSEFFAYLASALLLYVLLHVIRASIVFSFWGAGLRKLGYGISFKEAVMMTYSGLRGAVGLALAMIVETDAAYGEINKYIADLIGFQVGTIVVLTLLINGATAGTLYNKLKIYRVSEFLDVLRNHGLSEVRAAAMGFAEDVRKTKSFGAGADWTLVWKLAPNFKFFRFKDGHLVHPHQGITRVLCRARNLCLRSCRKIHGPNRLGSTRTISAPQIPTDSDTSEPSEDCIEEDVSDLHRLNSGIDEHEAESSKLAYAGMRTGDKVFAYTTKGETRANEMGKVLNQQTSDPGKDEEEDGEEMFGIAMAKKTAKRKKAKVLKRTKTPKELKFVDHETIRKLSRKKFNAAIEFGKTQSLKVMRFTKLSQVQPHGLDDGEDEEDVYRCDMQQQMYMMLMGSMKRFYQEDNEVHGTLDSRALLYLCDAVDRARDQLMHAAKKVFKKKSSRPRANSKVRRPTLTPNASINGEDDGKDHVEPLTAFWARLEKVLKLQNVKDHSRCCYTWSFENVQSSIQALHSVMQTTSKIRAFLHESLIPMQSNSLQTRHRLQSIERQLTKIYQDAQIYIDLIEEDYEQDVRVAKSIIVARQIIRHCSAEIDKLYSHGIFGTHVKEELKEHLLAREMQLLYYGDCWVMLRPC